MSKQHQVAEDFAAQLRDRGYGEDSIAAHMRQPAPEGGKAKARRSVLAPAVPTHVMTQSGRRVCLLDPIPYMICADDIAHGLAHVCRFSGQTAGFYSVAQHSMLVASLVPAPLTLHALLHDASEAYAQDVPTPVKALLRGYAVIERKLMDAIAASFGLRDLDANEQAALKRADGIAAHAEMRDLFPAGAFDTSGLPPIPRGVRIAVCQPPLTARTLLLQALADAGAA